MADHQELDLPLQIDQRLVNGLLVGGRPTPPDRPEASIWLVSGWSRPGS